MTTRELAEKIDELIKVRVIQHCLSGHQTPSVESFNSICDKSEKAQMIIRAIADGLTEHSACKGVCGEGIDTITIPKPTE